MQNRKKIIMPGEYYCLSDNSPGDKNFFVDDADYTLFLSLIQDKLSIIDSVDIVAYCLAPNHFKLLFFKNSDYRVTEDISNVFDLYNDYYFGKYKARNIITDRDYIVNVVPKDKLVDMSCMIHSGVSDWRDCEHSSIRAYFYDDVPKWVNKNHIASLYGSAVKYEGRVKEMLNLKNV